jgi:hypothetical protein
VPRSHPVQRYPADERPVQLPGEVAITLLA